MRICETEGGIRRDIIVGIQRARNVLQLRIQLRKLTHLSVANYYRLCL